MPVYAEIAVTETVGRYVIESTDFELHLEPDLQVKILDALARLMAKTDFQAISKNQKKKLNDLIVQMVSESDFQGKNNAEIQSAIDAIVTKALEKLEIEYSPPKLKKILRSHPLGYIATDHVGYASFDLRNFHKTTLLEVSALPDETEYAFYVYPMGKEELRQDALTQARVTKEAVFAKFSIPSPTALNEIKAINLPSMQNPSLVDWYFSPGSFASKPEFLVGQDGCEHLVPAQLALHQFSFQQVVRLGDTPAEWSQLIPDGTKFAYVDEYQANWYSLGHSLGGIQYSLPLAPGETVKLAVIDWSWDSLTTRDEKTKFSEEVLHQTHRDRTISETVKASLEEWQRGGSFMAGLASSKGETSVSQYGNSASGTAFSLGGGYSTSSGSRDLAAQNVQRLSDSFVQASSAKRELNSTVVIQARQEEKESIQTRTFSNYNHSHTLTILYYEVLRHYKVEVEWKRRRIALLVQSQSTDFKTISDTELLALRYRLEDSLLDQALKPAFSVLQKLEAELVFQIEHNISAATTPTEPWWEGNIEFNIYEFGIRTGAKHTDDKVIFWIRTNEGDLVRMFVHSDLNDYVNLGDRFNQDGHSWFFLIPERKIKWKDIAGFAFELPETPPAAGDAFNDWSVDEITIKAFFDDGVIELAGDVKFGMHFNGVEHSSNSFTRIARPGSRAATVFPPVAPKKQLDKNELQLYNGLKAHLQQNAAYYQRLLSISRSPQDIQVELDSKPWPAGGDYSQHVAPIVLETFGNYVAYPFLDDTQELIRPREGERLERHAERLVTLPTRGVFAEGKLGHCNISEEIDNTRFWKWEEHPIPIQAPDIAPITAVTPQPQQTNIAAGAFPAALLSIVNPSPAPDPTGLGDALKLMAAGNIFRDMSGKTEVTDLLKKLSDNSVAIANVAGNLTKPGATSTPSASVPGSTGGADSGSGGNAGSSGGSGGTKGGGTQQTNSDRLNDAKNAMQIADQMAPANRNAVHAAAADSVIKALSDVKSTSLDDDLKKAAIEQAKLQFSTEFGDRIDPGSMTIFQAYFDLPIGSYGRQVIDQVSALLRAGSLRGIVRSDNLAFIDKRLTVPQQTTLKNAVAGIGNAAFAFFLDLGGPSLFSPIGAIVFVRNITITTAHPLPDLGFQINAKDFSERDNEWRAAMAHEIVHAINPTSLFFPNNLVATADIWADQTLLSGNQSDVDTLRLFTGEIIGRYANWLVWQNILNQSEAVLPNEVFLATRNFLINHAAVVTVPPNPPVQPLYDISRYMQRLVIKANAKATADDANLVNKQASLWLKLVAQYFSLLYPDPSKRMQKLFLDASATTGVATGWIAPSGTPRGLH